MGSFFRGAFPARSKEDCTEEAAKTFTDQEADSCEGGTDDLKCKEAAPRVNVSIRGLGKSAKNYHYQNNVV
jgi:hypothetical protein